MERVEHDARRDAMMLIRDIEIRSREEAEWRSRRILAGVVQRMSHEVVKDATSTVIELPSEQMKGRIIGREGRNIRAFEAATGVSLIIDDKLPEAVVLNSFDPVRREVARIALEALIVDGRLNPTSVEESVAKAQSEVSHAIRDAGGVGAAGGQSEQDETGADRVARPAPLSHFLRAERPRPSGGVGPCRRVARRRTGSGSRPGEEGGPPA